MTLDECQHAVEAAARKIYATLPEGYAESVYEKAMAVEFRKQSVPYAIENNVEVLYEGECVGTQRLDFVIDGRMAVELKAAASLAKSHVAQTRAYLKTTDFERAILINFLSPAKEEPQIEVIESE